MPKHDIAASAASTKTWICLSPPNIYIYICMYVCMYVCVYVCVYIYICPLISPMDSPNGVFPLGKYYPY